MNEVVKYSNELNRVNFSPLNENQLNVLFTLLAKMRHEQTKDGITIPTKELFRLADISDGGGHRSKLLSSLGVLQEFKFQYEFDGKGGLRQEIIFPVLDIFDDDKQEFLNVKVSPAFRERYLKAMPEFTRFELEEFVNLSGTYTKTLYRFLKQFRTSGLWRVKYDDFKRLLGIPESYQSCDIDKRIIKPAIKELSSERNIFDQRRTPFKGLCVKKVKSGRSIEALEFCFEPQPVSDIERDKVENKRNLATIVGDIKRQDMLRQLKRESLDPKAGGVSVEELQIYLYRNLRLYDKKFDRYNVVKIQRILTIPNSDGVRIEWQNVDDGFKQHYDLSSAAKAQNFIEKYVV